MGAALTAETCPQYLVLDDRAVERHGALAKIAPPLREAADSEALWGALADGTLSLVASDHSPFLPQEKLGVDYAQAPQGLPTVELLVPVVLDAAARGALPLEAAVALVTSAPARLFGLESRKGRIAVGCDADVVLFSLGEPYCPNPNAFHTRAAGCAVVFDDVTLHARLEQTVVNGRVVFDRGRIVGDPAGRFAPGRAASLEPEPV